MAQEKYVSVRQLKQRINQLRCKKYVSLDHYDHYGAVDHQTNQAINMIIRSSNNRIEISINVALEMMLMDLEKAIEDAAVDGGQCFLCRPSDDDTGQNGCGG